MCTIRRPLGGADAVATYYENGAQLGDAVSFTDAETDWDFSGDLFISGTNDDGDISEFVAAGIYNRELTALDALKLAMNGPDATDIGSPGKRASNANIVSNSDFESWFSAANLQVWTEGSSVSASVSQVTGGDQYSGTYSVQFTGAGVPSVTVNNVIMQDKFATSDVGRRVRFLVAARRISGSGDLHVGQGSDQFNTISTAGSGLDGTWRLFVIEKTLTDLSNAQKRQVQFSGDSGSVFQVGLFETQFLGITGLWSAEHAQSDTGQVLDQIHTSHALLPSTGTTRIPQNLRPVIESPSAHSWTATDEIQYVAGNQALMSADDSFLVIDIDSDTAFSIDLGDGSDQDRFVAAYALSVGKNRLTIANPFNDGTNRKLTVKPTASVTAEITVHAEMIKERI